MAGTYIRYSAQVTTNIAVPGSNTQVMYNNGGILAGSPNMTFDGTTFTAAQITTPNNGLGPSADYNILTSFGGNIGSANSGPLQFDGSGVALTIPGGGMTTNLLVGGTGDSSSGVVATFESDVYYNPAHLAALFCDNNGTKIMQLGLQNGVELFQPMNTHDHTISYTPTAPADWGSTVPTNIQQALDLLAAKVAPVS